MITSGSPSSGQLQIGIALVLQDRFTNQAREASSAIRQLHNQAKQVTNANLSAVQTIASTGAAVGATVVGGIANAIQESSQYVHMMTMVEAIAKKTSVTMDELNRKAIDVGMKTIFKSKDVAEAMRFMAMSGMNTKEIYGSISSVANLAAATMNDMGGRGGAADAMTHIIRMFSIGTDDKSTARVSDILAMGTARSNMTLQDLSESIKYAGSTARNLGAGLEQVTAMAGVLGNAGIQGSMAGTSIANMYRYLGKSIANPNFKGHKALMSLGFTSADFIDSKGNLIDMGLALEKISKATQNTGNVEYFNDLVDIMGVRGERAATVLLKSFGKYSELLQDITHSQGFAAQVGGAMMQDIWGKLEFFTSSIETMKVRFTESIAPLLITILKPIAWVINKVTEFFQIPFVGPMMAGMIGLSSVIITVRLGIIALKATLKLLFNDSTVTFAGMMATMKAGWKGVTYDAKTYAAVEAGIIAQRKAGMGANGRAAFGAAYASTMSAGGLWVNNLKQTPVGKGFRYFSRDPVTGGIVRISEARFTAGMAGYNHIPNSLTNPAPGSRVGAGKVIGGLFAAGGLGGVVKGLFQISKAGGILSKILPVLGFIKNLLGGWVGIAFMAISVLLPPLITWVSKLFNSNDNNTKAVEENTRAHLETKPKTTLTNDQKMALMINAMADLTNQLKNQKPGQVIIQTDGKETMRFEIDRALSQHIKDSTK